MTAGRDEILSRDNGRSMNDCEYKSSYSETRNYSFKHTIMEDVLAMIAVVSGSTSNDHIYCRIG